MNRKAFLASLFAIPAAVKALAKPASASLHTHFDGGNVFQEVRNDKGEVVSRCGYLNVDSYGFQSNSGSIFIGNSRIEGPGFQITCSDDLSVNKARVNVLALQKEREV